MGKRKRWSVKEKIEIIEKAAEGDVIGVCRKYGISTGTYYLWRKKYETNGEGGLKENYQRQDSELKQAEEKVRILSKLLAERDIELEVQREMLKKKIWDKRSKKDLVKRTRMKYAVSVRRVLEWVGLPESSYYYKDSGKRKGAKPSVYTKHKEKGLVQEPEVVKDIKTILSHEFIDCGYRIMSAYLKQAGYIINHKKVYRIMRKNGLLKANARISRNPGGKKYVRFRKVKTSYPMQCLEMDIKIIWIPNKGKNAYLLSVIDVHTRKILGYKLDWHMKQDAVIELLSEIVDSYGIAAEMIIRSDNGSQFIANSVREYISVIGIEQEFTHVATPEENAHIESYHGTLKRDIFDRIEYHNFGQIQQIIKRYVQFYNDERLHGKLGKITPNMKWNTDEKLIPRRLLSA